MAKRLTPLHTLTVEQQDASAPAELAWVSASAGTGKTQVLTARVMRLLLHGIKPESILCLTFTKAGAAEMAQRIHERLAHWVRLKGPKLATELRALGEPFGADALAEARKLFASVLDARGGGLRIQTIHAFAQSVLAAFPIEAGMTPGFRALDEREEAQLAQKALSDMLVEADGACDAALIGDIQILSRRLGEYDAQGFLQRCGRAGEAMAGLGPPELIEDRLREAFGVPLGDIDTQMAKWVSDDLFEIEALKRVAAANAAWGTKTGLANADCIAAWLGASSANARIETLQELREVCATKAGDLRKFSPKLLDAEPHYAELAEGLDEAVSHLIGVRVKAEFAAFAAAALRAGQRFAGAYEAAKRREGAVDFGDLIRKTRDLLAQRGIGDWVRYKLDQSIDHILVDEAQDTNADQWAIVRHLAEEFFQTEPDETGHVPHRTIFSVGDFKQAIFGFQGTNPRMFVAAREMFRGHAAERERILRDVSLDRSYRSTPPVLDLVDAVMNDLGPGQIGLDREFSPHESGPNKVDLPGRVTLLRPVTMDDARAETAEESWIADSTLLFARRLAEQVKAWIDPADPLWLAGEGRPIRPEDILILLRSRGELASLIVARLHEEGVPVAGVDRLLLTDPLAIQDLLAALRFALQPHDDLTLATLLVSPLFGWNQGELYQLAKGRKSSLWSALRDRREIHPETLLGIDEILDQADLVTPYQLLESILSGPLDGRRKILVRLGNEARDPIEELLNRALQFETEHAPSLQHFLDWFENGEAVVKRDAEAPLDAVRVMTVHGAKGLQAPLVVLADATRNPDNMPVRSIDIAVGDSVDVPIPAPRKAEQLDALEDAVEEQKRKEREEHWRLLYVAMTRAEERLVIGGALGERAKEGPPPESWYAAIERSIEGFDGEWTQDARWEEVRHFEGSNPASPPARRTPRARRVPPAIAQPDWLRRNAPDEERPPRPLAPSALGSDDVSDPPPGADMRAAAERGKLLHRLFERLPDVAPKERREAARRWLEDAAGIDDAEERKRLASDALGVIDDPEFAAIFGPDALAEAPIAAVVDDVVISGTVDRLLIDEDRIQIVDFKTGRFVPASPEDIPLPHLRQMAAYAAALREIFPERPIEAALLYSGGPKLVQLTPAMIEVHKPRFADTQESLSPLG